MKFREFHPGQIIDAGPCELTEFDILDFARQWDPQWFHTEPQAATSGPFGGLIASGMHTLAVAMRLLVPAALAGSESLASPGLAYVKWPHPVRAGDRLRLRATVLEVRRSSSKPHLGILRWRWQLFNQADREVLDTEATSLFRLADTPPAPAPGAMRSASDPA